MKVKRKLKGNTIVLTIRLQSAIEVHLFYKATFAHDEYSTEFSDWCDDEINNQHHRFGSMNLTIHKSGDILFSNFFGMIMEHTYDTQFDERGTYEQVNGAVDSFVHYIKTEMGV